MNIKATIRKIKDTISGTTSYSKSVVSTVIDTPVSLELAKQRLNSCLQCTYFAPSVSRPGKHICTKCRCGERKILEDAVYEYPYLECPLGMPGFSNEIIKEEK